MSAILSKAGCYVAIIIMGWTLRRIGFFKDGDFQIIAKIVLRVTLPASIVYSFAGKENDPSMLLLSLFGFLLGIMYILVGLILSAGKDKREQGFTVLNIAGFNIGNFTMPFAQGFLGADGVITTSLFDTGNAFICLGMAYSIAAMVQRGERFAVKKVIRDLTKSVPFDTYIIMASFSLLHVKLPAPVTEFAGIVGSANAFMAMLMLGVGFRFSGEKSQIGAIVRILAVRYGIAVVVALGCYYLLPMGLEARQTLALLVFSPIASAAPAFTGELEGDTGLSSAINSISIIISLVCIVSVLLIIL